MNRAKSVAVADPLVVACRTKMTKAGGPTMLPSVLMRVDEGIR